jgi:hypothetical protein
MGYNTINPAFTGRGTSAAPSAFTTQQGELLSNYSEVPGQATLQNLGTANSPAGEQIARGKLVVESKAVKAGTRAIKTAYTIELQQDLAAVHGQDVETLMMEGLQYELQQELDRELLIRMRSAAINTALGAIRLSNMSPSHRTSLTPKSVASLISCLHRSSKISIFWFVKCLSFEITNKGFLITKN